MGTEMPVVSKMFCSSKEVVLEVRTRPHVIGGGGFVVTDVRSQQVMFRVDGCGVVGKKDHITISHAAAAAAAATQTPLLLIRRRKGGIVEALSLHKEWGGYSTSSYEGGGSSSYEKKKKKKKLVFTLKDPKLVECLGNYNRVPIRVSLTDQQKMINCSSNNCFEIKGNFPDRECSVVDCAGNIIAQVGVGVEKKDVYQVVVKAGIDQAFVVGVIAILDYIHNGSTRC